MEGTTWITGETNNVNLNIYYYLKISINSIMIKSFKYKLLPTDDQRNQLIQIGGSCRWLYNYMLNLNIEKYDLEKKFLFKYDMIMLLPNLKQEYEFLNQVPGMSLQQKCMDLDVNINRVFKSGFGFPKFKLKHNLSDSFRIPQCNGHINPKRKQIKIPKIGWINCIKHRPLQGKLKSITIKQEDDHWYCVCLCEISDIEKITTVKQEDIIGIDLGLIDFAITSDGEVFKTQKFYRKKQKKLARLQRKLSKKQKGSKNREKARKKLNKLHKKIANQRKDFTHKISNQITKDYLIIGVEDLNIQGMKQNRKLAKSISDQGWSMFLAQLNYKTKQIGGDLIKIDRWAPSTKTCSCCGNKQILTLDQRTFICANCDNKMSRDINAAINIRKFAINEINRAGTVQIQACGDTAVGDLVATKSRHVSMKQEKFLTNNSKEA